MPDREKVITGLELCTDISQDGCMMLCPYRNEQDETYSGFCEQVLKQDALALLKEQESVEPWLSYDGNEYLFHCTACDAVIYHNGANRDETKAREYAKFCRQCGRRVKWECG